MDQSQHEESAGKRVSKSQLGLENEIRWAITFDTHHLMNQSEHEESAGKRVWASQVDSTEM